MKKSACVIILLLLPIYLFCIKQDEPPTTKEVLILPESLQSVIGENKYHSEEYYNWMIKNIKEKIDRSKSNIRDIDKLIVAYDKLGHTEMSIRIAVEQLKKNPTRYTTNKNFTTYLEHNYYNKKIKLNSPEIKDVLVSLSVSMNINQYLSSFKIAAIGDVLLHNGDVDLATKSYLLASLYTQNEEQNRQLEKLVKSILLINNSLNIEEDELNNKIDFIRQDLNEELLKSFILIEEIIKEEKYWIDNGYNPEIEYMKKNLKNNK